MSLDGFVAGPNVSTEQPMGEGAGASVHDWMFSGRSDAEAERFGATTSPTRERSMSRFRFQLAVSLDGYVAGVLDDWAAISSHKPP